MNTRKILLWERVSIPRYWPGKYKASLDVSCRVTRGRVHANAWACGRGCTAPESIERAAGRGRGHCTLARARTHGRTHSSTYARVTEASASKIGHLPQNPQLLTREAKSYRATAIPVISIPISMPRDLAGPRFAPLFGWRAPLRGDNHLAITSSWNLKLNSHAGIVYNQGWREYFRP